MKRILTRMDRLRRRFGFDDNELRREVDRAQWMVGLLLLVFFLGVAPVSSARLTQDAYRVGVRAERAQSEGRHEVLATILKVVELPTGRDVTVAWNEPDGRPRTASYTTYRGAMTGDRMKVWAGPAGVSERAPRSHARTVTGAAGLGIGTVLGLGLPLLAIYLVVRHRCDRRRSRLWDAEWATFDARHIG